MPFKTGLQTLASDTSSGSDRDRGSISKLGYISWKDGDKKIIRFLTDEPITGEFKEFVQTKNGGTQDFLINPDTEDWVAKFGGQSKEFGTGNLITPTPRKIGVCIAVLRDEQPVKNGRGTTIVDASHEVTEGDVTYPARYFGIVKQTKRNFWSHFEGVIARYGTICDRDYEITRSGADKFTSYKVAPIDPIDELRDLAVLQAHYGYGCPWNEKDPNRWMYCPETLLEWADYYSGEERARHWLVSEGSTINLTGGHVSTLTNGQIPPLTDGLDEFAQPDEAQAAPSATAQWQGLKDALLPHVKSNS